MRPAAHQRVHHRERILQQHRDPPAAHALHLALGRAPSGRGRQSGSRPVARRPAAGAARSPSRSATCRSRIRRRWRSLSPRARSRSVPTVIVVARRRRRRRSTGCGRREAALATPRSAQRSSGQPLEQPVADQVHADRGQDDHRRRQQQRRPGWRTGWCGSRTASGPSPACPARRRGRGTKGRRG